MRRTWPSIAFSVLAAAFAARALYVAAAHFRQATATPIAGQVRHDQAVLETMRYSVLLAHLPPAGTVGYLAWNGPDRNVHVRHYILLQYTLAPLIVHDSSDEALVVGDFPSDAQLLAALHTTNLRVHDWLGHAAPGLAILENPGVSRIPRAGELPALSSTSAIALSSPLF